MNRFPTPADAAAYIRGIIEVCDRVEREQFDKLRGQWVTMVIEADDPRIEQAETCRRTANRLLAVINPALSVG